MLVVAFSPLALENTPRVDSTDLSSDQKYLHDICQVIGAGVCPEDIALRKPGPVVHSRWLTTARIWRLYISSEKPSEQLLTLIVFIMKVHASVWFNIKVASSCVEDSRHLVGDSEE